MSISTKSSISTAALQALGRVGAAQPTTRPDPGADGDDRVGPASEAVFSNGAGPHDRPASHAMARLAASDDSRYVRFVEAVQALRIDLDMTTLTQSQIDRIMESAQRIFMLDDGVPKPVEPPRHEATVTEFTPSDPARDDEPGPDPGPPSRPR